MVVQELLILVLLLWAAEPPLGIRQGLGQDGGAQLSAPSSLSVVVPCSLLTLSSGGAAASPPEEPKHFHHTNLKRKNFHNGQSILRKRCEALNFRHLLSSKGFHSSSFTNQTPYDWYFLSLKEKLIKKILGFSGYISHPPISWGKGIRAVPGRRHRWSSFLPQSLCVQKPLTVWIFPVVEGKREWNQCRRQLLLNPPST